MKQEIKKQREQEKLAEFLGIDVNEVAKMAAKDGPAERVREVQAILLFVERPDAFIRKVCDHCKHSFLTTYQFVSVCSDTCRKNSLLKIGIDWRPINTPEERWQRAGVPIEYTIPPKALDILLEIAIDQGYVYSEPDPDNSEIFEAGESVSVNQAIASGFVEGFAKSSITSDALEDLDSLLLELDL